jgi:hypothetical protein
VVERGAIPAAGVMQRVRAEELEQVATHAEQVGPPVLLLEPLGHGPEVVEFVVETLEGPSAPRDNIGAGN